MFKGIEFTLFPNNIKMFNSLDANEFVAKPGWKSTLVKVIYIWEIIKNKGSIENAKDVIRKKAYWRKES